MAKLEDITFCFLDVETTGLNCESGDKVCEIGLFKRKGMKTIDTYSTLIDPECEISEGAFLVNGISGDMLKGKPKFSEVADFILKFIDDTVIVCHNAPFDLGFLNQEVKLAGLQIPQNLVIDTLAIARKYYRFPDNKLKTVAYFLGFGDEGMHRAGCDVFFTCQIFEYFLKDFQNKGINILDEIMERDGLKI